MALRKLSKVLAQTSCRNQSAFGARMISCKAMREVDPNKPKPFPYEKDVDFRPIPGMFEKTTLRLDENSKLIVVDGAHAIGKSQFAEELAEELEMVYYPYPRMDDCLINSYGVDLRQFNDLMIPINKTYDEKDFARNPVGPVEGCADRLHFDLFREKYRNHIHALRHIFNTGQGVVMEGTPFNDYAYFDAAYNQGWIDRNTRNEYKEMLRMCLHMLMKPNLYIYLDAPTDVAMKNIQGRGNEWDKNSPVWTNKQYLSDIYNELKKNFLKEQQRHSRVLVYDWTEPGDMEIVVEDIESINFDFLEETDEQQKDWRLGTEERYAETRQKYCNATQRNNLFNQMRNTKSNFSCVHLYKEPHEQEQLEDAMHWIKSERYAPGFNASMGDKNILFRGFPFSPNELYTAERKNRYWMSQRWARNKTWFDSNDEEGY